MKNTKVAIIGGAGNVGSSIAYALMLRNIVAELILIDIDQLRVVGQVKDLSDALTFSRTSKVFCGSYRDAADADIIIIAAGKGQKPEQKRAELVHDNAAIVSSIIQKLQPINEKAIIIVVTNPVDVMTMVVQKEAGMPRNQIFGSGTFLDTQRLRSCIGSVLGVGSQSVHAYVLGEHGDEQFVAWSTADVGGVPLAAFPSLTPTMCKEMAVSAKEQVYEIIEAKGATYFGVAACVSAYCENILFDIKRVLPLSCYQENLGVCLSMPTVLGIHGAEQIFDVPLSDDESKKLIKAAEKIKKAYESLV